ncbi:peptide chain release factor 1 [Herpetosiphon giganteus]|nr:peptide chain release factor 1 [Herpetosiphon giganteus]MBM7845246.1 peptide chain release factor 1 [Herpetosiphon giganteus]
MEPEILARLARVEARYIELNDEMTQPDVLSDHVRLTTLAREQTELGELVGRYREFLQAEKALEESKAMLREENDPELREMAQMDIEELSARMEAIGAEVRILLLPRDPNDEKNVIIEIRQGEGGDEAALFSADVYRMYQRYAETRGWKTELMSLSENGIGGFKEVIFEVQGQGAWSRLKYEGGVHRVQRVPATEARGRIHTSTITVAVLPEVEETAVEIKQEDYRIDVYRSGGHGGQGVNTTDSAVRIVYKAGTPDEIVVVCQDTRSQIKNRESALNVLRARLYAREQEKRQKELGESRLAQVGSGERAEKMRTYNYPQDRITDHRIGQNISNLPVVLDGALDRLIDALVTYDNAERLKALGMGA